LQAPKKTLPVRDALRAKTPAAEPSAPAPPDQHAIDEGRKTLDLRRKDLPAIQTKATELYGIPAAGLPAVTPIESGFHFSSAESDNELHFLQVEALIEEATVLLERCAAHRDRRDQLQLEKWKSQLDLDRFFRLEQLRAKQREAGNDTLAYERAALDAGAAGAMEAHQKAAEAQLKNLSDDLLSAGFNKRMAARELAAWISAFPLKDSELRGDNASYTFDGVQRNKPDHLFEAARMEADEAAWEQATNLSVRRSEALAAAESARLRKESLNRQARWSLSDIAFRGEAAQIEADTAWERIFQAQAANGLFNYAGKIAPVERQFAADFREALAHLAAARRGLKDLFDYAPTFPQEGSTGYLDEVTAWVRQTKMRLARAGRTDQTYTLALSLKDLTKGQWEAGRGAGQWAFDLPEDLFQGQSHVRLRGVGLAVTAMPEPPELPTSKKNEPPPPPKPEGFWSARISLPATGVVRLRSGQTHEIDQKALPVCCLGQVAESLRQPEIAGAAALHNASPIGKQWRVILSQKSTTGAAISTLQDVHLFLRIAVRG
jgi:hypothetical protein